MDPITWIIYTVVMASISLALGHIFKKKPNVPNAKPQAFEVPTPKQDFTYGVIFGTPKRVISSALVWWGHTAKEPIMDSVEGEDYISGYLYRAGMCLRLSHGPVDGVLQVWKDDKPLWPNKDDRTQLAADDQTSIWLDEWVWHPGWFGRWTDRSGVHGQLTIQYGYRTQAVNSYLAARLGSNISAGRGLVSAIFERIYIGDAPYIPTFGFLLKRTDILDDESPQWYLAKADIDNDLNAAHMLRECYTCQRWGAQYSVSLFDDADWKPFADALYAEGFGLSYNWNDESQEIEDLIDEIKRHIDGTVYQDPETGKFVPKLLRNDYDIESLETFDESDIESINDFVRPSYGNIPDRFVVKIINVFDNEVVPIPDQDPAVRAIQGKSIEVNMDFLMITKAALGAKVVARERFKVTSMPATMTIKAKRTMSHLRPFDVFNLSYPISPKVRIDSMVVRILEADYGTLENGYVTFKCAQDVFAMQQALYSTPPESGWQEPASEPAASPYRLLIEAPFYALADRLGVSLALQLDDDAGYLVVCASQPSDDSAAYELLVRESLTADFISKGGGAFTPTATIDVALPTDAVDVEIDLSNFEFPAYILEGRYAQIGEELVKMTVVNYDEQAGTLSVTIARGVLDTIPASHAADSRIWFIGSLRFFVNQEYAATAQPGTKVLPFTSLGRLDPDLAPIDNATAFNSRMIRPYPPGNFKINNVSYPGAFSGEPTLTWSHRDRTQQTQSIIEHDAGSIGPEAGVTYTLKIYDAGNTLRRTETGLTGTSYTYIEADEISEVSRRSFDLSLPPSGTATIAGRATMLQFRGRFPRQRLRRWRPWWIRQWLLLSGIIFISQRGGRLEAPPAPVF
jgi:hypothetical protein